jgi:hypothetical protein
MSTSLPTHHDAELILKLYDLRREPVMREARNFVFAFSPASIDDVMTVFGAFGTKENAYLRQVFGYWEMAAALVVHGTLNAALAQDTLQEMYFVYSIVEPFLSDIREKAGAPDFMKNVQKVVESTPEGRERVERIKKRRAEIMSRAKAAKQGN